VKTLPNLDHCPFPELEQEPLLWICLDWFDLTKETPEHLKPKGKPEGLWAEYCETPEEAIERARFASCERWQWDEGLPPISQTHDQAIAHAKSKGVDGYCIVKQIGGIWTVDRIYPVGERGEEVNRFKVVEGC
jgi:hypothetical protein